MDDRERLRRYLEWRERTDRPAQHAVRQRRLRRAFIGAAVGVVGIAGFAWISYGTGRSAWLARHDAPATAGRATDVARDHVARETDGAAEPQSPPVIERAPAAPAAAAPAVRRTPRAAVRTAARSVPARKPVRAEPPDESAAPSAAPSEGAASATDTTPDVGGDSTPTVVSAVPSTPPPAASAPPQVPPPAQDAPVVVSVPPVAQTSPVAEPPVVTPAPGTVTSIESKPDCADVTNADSPDGRTRGQRVADCARGWLKGQSQEFRDGIKRQTDDFRTGLDRVGRGLQWLGSKLRRPE